MIIQCKVTKIRKITVIFAEKQKFNVIPYSIWIYQYKYSVNHSNRKKRPEREFYSPQAPHKSLPPKRPAPKLRNINLQRIPCKSQKTHGTANPQSLHQAIRISNPHPRQRAPRAPRAKTAPTKAPHRHDACAPTRRPAP